MKPSFFLNAILAVGLLTCLSLSAPAFGGNETTALLSQARDLVHQAWNPDGDPPSDDTRTDLLTKALNLVQQAPPWRGYEEQEGSRHMVLKYIQAALDALHNGADADKVTGLIQKADIELSRAIS
jgi:hypothetical protein